MKSTNYNWYNRHFQVLQLFQFPSKVELPSLLFTFFQFHSEVRRDSKVHNSVNSLFLLLLLLSLIIIRSGRLAGIWWSVCISKSQWSLCALFSRTDSELCLYHLSVWLNLNFLHNSQWISLFTHSCLVLYSFCANLLHSFIIWFIVSSLSPHKLHLLFYCVLSILTLIWFVLIALFCAAMRKDSVFLLRILFLIQVHVFSYEMSLVSSLKRP